MGSKEIQGELWGRNPSDWAAIQEQTGNAGYQYVLKAFNISANDRLLDIGCGSGIFSDLAQLAGATVTGIDASEPLLEEAKRRNPAVTFIAGEMEELPFDDQHFTIVCGFNSFQYAASVQHALEEAWRVLQKKGRLAAMIWGNREDCESAIYIKALGSLMPAPPPGAAGPFALSENRLLEKLLSEAGFFITSVEDVTAVWEYNDLDTALKGLLSAGPAAKAITHAGPEKVRDTVATAIEPFIQPDGKVILRNKFRVVIAGK